MSAAEPLFSVILPTYMRTSLFEAAIASLLAQSVEDFEVIVVDDASPEPPHVPDDPRVRVIRRVVRGTPPGARNTGLQVARGRFVTFLDDDDLYTPDRLESAVEGIRQGATLALCWIKPINQVHASRWQRYLANENRMLSGNVRDVILDGARPHLGQITIERSICPAFDERYIHVEDLEWWLRASKEAKVVTVPRVGYLTRQHHTSGEAPRFSHANMADRVGFKLLFMQENAEYFRHHPRATARQWRDIARIAANLGDYPTARVALVRSLRLRLDLRMVKRLLRSLRPRKGRPPVYQLPPEVEFERLRGMVPNALRRELVARDAEVVR